MPNTDKVKAARTGGDVKYKQKVQGISTASRVAHENSKRLDGVHHQLRAFEDAGFGVSTGRQYEHEERMREQKQKREAKAAKSAAFRASLEAAEFEATEPAALLVADTDETEGAVPASAGVVAVAADGDGLDVRTNAAEGQGLAVTYWY